MSSRVLVLGPTGNVGAPLVRELVAERVPLRTGVRQRARATALADSTVELVDFDYDDPATYSRALDGVDRLFLLTPVAEKMVEMTARLVDAAKRSGVRRIVKLSAMGADEDSMVFAKWHREAERIVEASGIAWTHVRPNAFLQNFTAFYAASIRAKGMFFAPQGDGRVSYVDARDVAAVGARALVENGHEGRAYDVTGGEALSLHDGAAEITRAIGKPVRYVPVDDDGAEKGMSAHMPAWRVKAILDLYRVERTGGAARVTTAVEEVTGRKPRTLQTYVNECRAAFL